jgi:hypothetical protein
VLNMLKVLKGATEPIVNSEDYRPPGFRRDFP